MFRLCNELDIRRLVLGATVLGTGGGGDPREGLELLINSIVKRGACVDVLSPNELPEDIIAVQPYYVGSVAPGLKSRKAIKIKDPIRRAVKELESLLGSKVGAVVPTELGGGNTAVAISIAAELGVPVVDGDLMGRAGPELHQCTLHIFKVPLYPSVIVTETGNVVVIKEYSDIDDYEAIARYLSVLSGRHAAVVDAPMKVDVLRKVVIEGTLSLCLRVGKAIEESRELGRDPVAEVAKVLNGWVVFHGKVVDYRWRNEGGFLKGEVYLEGLGRFKDSILKSWMKNEHIMAWLNNEPLIMPPDLIIFLRPDGEPVTNTELKVGDEVYVVAAKAPDVWRSEEGLKYFGPKHFGLNYDYVPVEELLRIRGLT